MPALGAHVAGRRRCSRSLANHTSLFAGVVKPAKLIPSLFTNRKPSSAKASAIVGQEEGGAMWCKNGAVQKARQAFPKRKEVSHCIFNDNQCFHWGRHHQLISFLVHATTSSDKRTDGRRIGSPKQPKPKPKPKSEVTAQTDVFRINRTSTFTRNPLFHQKHLQDRSIRFAGVPPQTLHLPGVPSSTKNM